jgi:hypothetical protein
MSNYVPVTDVALQQPPQRVFHETVALAPPGTKATSPTALVPDHAEPPLPLARASSLSAITRQKELLGQVEIDWTAFPDSMTTSHSFEKTLAPPSQTFEHRETVHFFL